MLKISCVMLSLLTISTPIAAQVSDGSECAQLNSSELRLSCYDSIFRDSKSSATNDGRSSAWKLDVTTSKLDDHQEVKLLLDSDLYNAKLTIACRKPEILFRVSWGRTVFMNSQLIDYRIDENPPQKEYMSASRSGASIVFSSAHGPKILLQEFLQQLTKGKSLYLRAVTTGGYYSEATFNISGLEDALAPLRVACEW